MDISLLLMDKIWLCQALGDWFLAKQFGQSIPGMYMDMYTKIDAILMPYVLRMTTILSTKKPAPGGENMR